jgi:hypothetical protein
MRRFQLDSSMTTMRGVFYPTGWTVLMLPSEQDAQEAGRKLQEAGLPADDMMLMSPSDFRSQVLGATGDDDMLPSAGTEGDTVRRFAEFAAQGHYGLLVHAGSSHEDSDRVMDVLKDSPISYGQKYRKLVIEDLVN